VAPNTETSSDVPLAHKYPTGTKFPTFTAQLGGLVERRDLAYWRCISWGYCLTF